MDYASSSAVPALMPATPSSSESSSFEELLGYWEHQCCHHGSEATALLFFDNNSNALASPSNHEPPTMLMPAESKKRNDYYDPQILSFVMGGDDDSSSSSLTSTVGSNHDSTHYNIFTGTRTRTPWKPRGDTWKFLQSPSKPQPEQRSYQPHYQRKPINATAIDGDVVDSVTTSARKTPTSSDRPTSAFLVNTTFHEDEEEEASEQANPSACTGISTVSSSRTKARRRGSLLMLEENELVTKALEQMQLSGGCTLETSTTIDSTSQKQSTQQDEQQQPRVVKSDFSMSNRVDNSFSSPTIMNDPKRRIATMIDASAVLLSSSSSSTENDCMDNLLEEMRNPTEEHHVQQTTTRQDHCYRSSPTRPKKTREKWSKQAPLQQQRQYRDEHYTRRCSSKRQCWNVNEEEQLLLPTLSFSANSPTMSTTMATTATTTNGTNVNPSGDELLRIIAAVVASENPLNQDKSFAKNKGKSRNSINAVPKSKQQGGIQHHSRRELTNLLVQEEEQQQENDLNDSNVMETKHVRRASAVDETDACQRMESTSTRSTPFRSPTSASFFLIRHVGEVDEVKHDQLQQLLAELIPFPFFSQF